MTYDSLCLSVVGVQAWRTQTWSHGGHEEGLCGRLQAGVCVGGDDWESVHG